MRTEIASESDSRKGGRNEKTIVSTPAWSDLLHQFALLVKLTMSFIQWSSSDTRKRAVNDSKHSRHVSERTVPISKYKWAVGWKQMRQDCTSVSPRRPWTQEDMMAWIDDDKRQQRVEDVSAQKEHADNNYSFQHRGLPEMWRRAEVSLAAAELEYAHDLQ
ncbi:hypothetical protein E4U31_001139 [Claviceps sp. LM219 group G6]|nr:hypothetical protein E4U31_001139 [Claviceps sp. LM219 group G6]